jgi:hypothetical protein
MKVRGESYFIRSLRKLLDKIETISALIINGIYTSSEKKLGIGRRCYVLCERNKDDSFESGMIYFRK